MLNLALLQRMGRMRRHGETEATNVVVFGATGVIGQGVLREAIRDPDVQRTVSVVRRSKRARRVT